MCADISRHTHTQKNMTLKSSAAPPQTFLTERHCELLHRKHRALEATTSPQGTRDALIFFIFFHKSTYSSGLVSQKAAAAEERRKQSSD